MIKIIVKEAVLFTHKTLCMFMFVNHTFIDNFVPKFIKKTNKKYGMKEFNPDIITNNFDNIIKDQKNNSNATRSSFTWK